MTVLIFCVAVSQEVCVLELMNCWCVSTGRYNWPRGFALLHNIFEHQRELNSGWGWIRLMIIELKWVHLARNKAPRAVLQLMWHVVMNMLVVQLLLCMSTLHWHRANLYKLSKVHQFIAHGNVEIPLPAVTGKCIFNWQVKSNVVVWTF